MLLKNARSRSSLPRFLKYICRVYARHVKSEEQLERERQASECPAHLTALFGSKITGPGGVVLNVSSLKGKVLGIYFSAHWCGPCRQFTPILADKYRSIIKSGHQFDIVFVSSDRSQSDADIYFKDMPWKALPFVDRARKDALSAKFGVQGIPTLVLLDQHGNVITLDGRSALMSKPFPFT